MSTTESAYEFGVVCEARADQLTACGLADRVLCQSVDWLEPELLDSTRKWSGEVSDEPFLKWARVKDLASKRGIKVFGRFDDRPDALTARKALLVFAAQRRCPDAVMLIRDSDGDSRRRTGLEQARNDRPWPFKVVIGVAHPKREAWVLAGFRPQNTQEAARLQALQARLSVDPIRKSHELDAREHGAKTDIKRALNELIEEGDDDRERRCIEETDLDTLEQRGVDNGLAEYLKEVRERLVPILIGHSPEQ